MIGLLDVSACTQGITPAASFDKEFNPRLAKRPLKTNGRLANRGLTSLTKEATEVHVLEWFIWGWGVNK